MTLRTCLIMMTALAVITDNLIIPFYPQYFAERFDNPPEQHVGLYLAVVSLVVMSVRASTTTLIAYTMQMNRVIGIRTSRLFMAMASDCGREWAGSRQ